MKAIGKISNDCRHRRRQYVWILCGVWCRRGGGVGRQIFCLSLFSSIAVQLKTLNGVFQTAFYKINNKWCFFFHYLFIYLTKISILRHLLLLLLYSRIRRRRAHCDVRQALSTLSSAWLRKMRLVIIVQGRSWWEGVAMDLLEDIPQTARQQTNTENFYRKMPKQNFRNLKFEIVKNEMLKDMKNVAKRPP